MDLLKLENQVCFPLYALSRMMTAVYQPLLDELNLTYPQYLVMMVLWEHRELSVKDIGAKLLLDSGTLTPLLKRMQEKQLLKRTRSAGDERVVLVTLTQTGLDLKTKAAHIPNAFRCHIPLGDHELLAFKDTLTKLLTKTETTINNN
ncbi:MarR family winged helix-turn-helix transcriptional regulator [Mucilaginibacter polytrichastri]|uniref:Organic hydroperoxide resistance transcriptional regulator n=1 Tax=Mucilaginibacter polytrichastri TaxID=1302689 RepID=A0A1Q5ZW54_9SPHI|nr:MarR family transcriptional regulator [Mucilaginibacter polytrichastri]OKS86005.1 Organic hydroperoxide resistance transcriptional regulator [Mucilaginibacter polytrichastri]SFS59779.1 DNA-binding transcriptional regulator, MarR family [Mucilaginibacter polytrichastri]